MESGDDPYTRGRLMNDEVYAYAWDNVWEWGVSNRAYKLANAGFKVCGHLLLLLLFLSLLLLLLLLLWSLVVFVVACRS